MTEIDKEFYCAGDFYYGERCHRNEDYSRACMGCEARHRKYPTPEQFKKEYDEDYTEDAPVWTFSNNTKEWILLGAYKSRHNFTKCIIVCACTPWGRPPNDWSPR